MAPSVAHVYTRSRTEKLGVKPGSRAAVIGLRDATFVKELRSAGAQVAARAGTGPCDMVIVRLGAVTDLPLLTDARKRIAPKGMIWAVWPKGRKEFREDDIRHFGPGAGLVDVKVMSFSDELSGLKLVIPLAQRQAARPRVGGSRAGARRPDDARSNRHG